MGLSCGASFVRYLFMGFNFIFWVLGIAVFAIGIYSRVETDGWKSLIDMNTLFVAANLLIAAGVIVATIGFFGCCGAIKKWQWMLIIYSIIVILIFILEVVAGALAYRNKDKVQKALEDGLQKALSSTYGKTDKSSKAMKEGMDLLQEKIGCCGSKNATDWRTSYWKTTGNLSGGKAVPKSCCRKQTATCNDNDNDGAKIYTLGCIGEGKKFVKKNLWLIGGVGVGIAVVELLSIAFAVGLICAFKKEDKEGGTA